MNADTAKKLAKLQQMQAEYHTMMDARRLAHSKSEHKRLNALGVEVDPPKEPNEPTAFQQRISQYADEIMAIEKREDRALALSKIPSDCRGWVEAEVRIRFDKRKGANQ